VIVTRKGKPVGFLARIDLVDYWARKKEPGDA
jgi:hypothetical protein